MAANSNTTWDHLKAILALPFMVLLVIPTIILYTSKSGDGEKWFNLVPAWLNYSLAAAFFVMGFPLFLISINWFKSKGKGTLAPWNPTRQLVVEGPYRYVRNPMIIGVILILLAESFFFQSASLLLWAGLFWITSHLFFLFWEEPDLNRRFGPAYREYCQHVSRWIPRLRPWDRLQ